MKLLIKSFPPTDGITYDKVTAYTEDKLKPWAKRLEDCEHSELKKGTKKMIYLGQEQEWSGRLYKGMLVGKIKT